MPKQKKWYKIYSLNFFRRYPAALPHPFQKQLRPSILQCQQGSVSLVGLAIILMITSYFLTIILNKIQVNKEAHARAQVYLCVKKGISLESSYLQRMTHFNQAIMTSFVLMKSPVPAVAQAAKATHKSLKVAQQLFHVSHLKQLKQINECQLENSAQWFIQQAYSRGFFLKRDQTGRAIKQVEQCQYHFFPNLRRTRLSKMFVIQVQRTQKKNKYFWESKEVSLNLRHSSGSASFSQLLSLSKRFLSTTIAN